MDRNTLDKYLSEMLIIDGYYGLTIYEALLYIAVNKNDITLAEFNWLNKLVPYCFIVK